VLWCLTYWYRILTSLQSIRCNRGCPLSCGCHLLVDKPQPSADVWVTATSERHRWCNSTVPCVTARYAKPVTVDIRIVLPNVLDHVKPCLWLCYCLTVTKAVPLPDSYWGCPAAWPWLRLSYCLTVTQALLLPDRYWGFVTAWPCLRLFHCLTVTEAVLLPDRDRLCYCLPVTDALLLPDRDWGCPAAWHWLRLCYCLTVIEAVLLPDSYWGFVTVWPWLRLSYCLTVTETVLLPNRDLDCPTACQLLRLCYCLTVTVSDRCWQSDGLRRKPNFLPVQFLCTTNPTDITLGYNLSSCGEINLIWNVWTQQIREFFFSSSLCASHKHRRINTRERVGYSATKMLSLR
jgi:hypothetical protein